VDADSPHLTYRCPRCGDLFNPDGEVVTKEELVVSILANSQELAVCGVCLAAAHREGNFLEDDEQE
jgi:hypothetical protein